MAVRSYRDAEGRTRYQVEFAQAGNRVFRRLPPLATKEQAVALETKLRRDIFDRVSLGKVAEITLAEAIAQWLQNVVPHLKDRKTPGQKAVLLAPFVRDRPLREVVDVAREAMQAWSSASKVTGRAARRDPALLADTVAPSINGRTSTRGRGLSPATINRRLAVLKAASRYAWEQGWIDQNLSGRIKALPENNKREIYLTPKQVKALARSANSMQIRAAIMIAAYSGLRAGELIAMAAPSSRADTLTVRVSKTGKPRLVPIAGPVRRYLSALPLGLSYDQLYKQFRAAAEAADMPHVHFHDLRHTCASMLINAGVDLYTVGKILGHSTTQTTARYSHLADATLQKAMRKLR